MSKEIYSAASGGMAAWQRMENISNNLANANTAGFKPQRISASTFEQHVAGAQVVTRTEVDSDAAGALRQDDVPTHMALEGRGFFEVREGEEKVLVRRGDFHLDKRGRLLDTAGREVQGTNGSITIPPGVDFSVSTDGTITGDDGDEIGKLRIVDADDVRVRGEGTWTATGELRVADAEVVQGAVEGAAVDPLLQLVELIEATRTFEALQKAMKTSDELDAMANQMARSG